MANERLGKAEREWMRKVFDGLKSRPNAETLGRMFDDLDAANTEVEGLKRTNGYVNNRLAECKKELEQAAAREATLKRERGILTAALKRFLTMQFVMGLPGRPINYCDDDDHKSPCNCVTEGAQQALRDVEASDE